MSGEKYSFFDVPEDDISPLFTNKLQEQAHVGCLPGEISGWRDRGGLVWRE